MTPLAFNNARSATQNHHDASCHHGVEQTVDLLLRAPAIPPRIRRTTARPSAVRETPAAQDCLDRIDAPWCSGRTFPHGVYRFARLLPRLMASIPIVNVVTKSSCSTARGAAFSLTSEFYCPEWNPSARRSAYCPKRCAAMKSGYGSASARWPLNDHRAVDIFAERGVGSAGLEHRVVVIHRQLARRADRAPRNTRSR